MSISKSQKESKMDYCIERAREYFGGDSANSPIIISQICFPGAPNAGGGWKSMARGVELDAAKLAVLQDIGATLVALDGNGNRADFAISELYRGL
jgi:hypothetical protein